MTTAADSRDASASLFVWPVPCTSSSPLLLREASPPPPRAVPLLRQSHASVFAFLRGLPYDLAFPRLASSRLARLASPRLASPRQSGSSRLTSPRLASQRLAASPRHAGSHAHLHTPIGSYVFFFLSRPPSLLFLSLHTQPFFRHAALPRFNLSGNLSLAAARERIGDGDYACSGC